jgi:hypothetical protein
LKVAERNTDRLVGRLVDVTTEGMMLISSEPIEMNRVFQLTLDLPEEMDGGPREVGLEARSLWTKKDANPDFLLSGFEFVTVAPEDLLTITDLIRQYELPGNPG